MIQENGKAIAGMKAGVGSSRIDLGNGIIVCALSVVNALGNIILPDGSILAGNRGGKHGERYETFKDFSKLLTDAKANTTISVVGLNVDLDTRENYERVAHIATHGHIRAINPVNTSVDGDTVFVFSNEEIKSFLTPLGNEIAKQSWKNLRVDIIGQAAANAVQESIYDACKQAKTIKLDVAYKGIIPSCNDY